MVRDQIGVSYEKYLPFIYGIFFFFLIGNLISNVPYSYAIAASGIVSIGFSITIFIGVTILGLVLHRLRYFRNFIPNGTPLPLVPLLTLIELSSTLARGVSLGVRMFSNIFSGHTLLSILSSFYHRLMASSLITAALCVLALPILVAIIGLEVAVSFIQSFVLTLLSCSYIKDSEVIHS